MSRRPVGSIRWIRDGLARVELRAGRDQLTGEPRRMSRNVHGNEVDAERALAQMLIEIGRLPSGRNMTLRDFLENLYYPALHARVRKETRLGYESKLNKWVIPQLGHLSLGDLEPYVLDRWRDQLLTKLSGRSALHVYRALATALNRAVKWRLTASNPLDAVDAPRASVRDLTTLSADESVAYLRAFTGHKLEPLVVIAIATGLRPCELAGLDWSHIDLSAGEVHVERGLHERKSETWFEEPKSTRSRRVVSLPAWSVEALKPLRGIGALVIEDGERMRPTAIARHYRRHVNASKLRYVPLRDLRHTHATLMLEAGVDVVVVSRRLGHSTIAITDAHYLRPRRSADQKAADAFGQMLASKGVSGGQASSGVSSLSVNE